MSNSDNSARSRGAQHSNARKVRFVAPRSSTDTAPDLGARAITAALGGNWHGDHGMARCPAHLDRTASCKLRDDPSKADAIDVHCFAGCPWQAVKQALQHLGLIARIDPRNTAPPTVANRLQAMAQHQAAVQATAAAREADDRRFIHATLASLSPLCGTPAAAYLRWRLGGAGLPATLDRQALGFHPAVRHPAGRPVPALVARITDAGDAGRLIGLHFIALTTTGHGKAEIEPRKWTRGRMQGGVVRLVEDAEVTGGLGLCEGIETGVAILASDWSPVWATLSAGNLKASPVLHPVNLTLWADRDPSGTGMQAATKAATRWREAGLNAQMIEFSIPPATAGD